MAQARKRSEAIKRSTMPFGTRLDVSRQDVLDVSGGYVVRDDGHSSTVWVGSVGIASGPETVRAGRPDEAFLIRDGKRRKATTYTDARFPSGRVRNKANRLERGIERLNALLATFGGRPEPVPTRGLLPCTLPNVPCPRPDYENRDRIALWNGERFDTISGEFIDG